MSLYKVSIRGVLPGKISVIPIRGLLARSLKGASWKDLNRSLCNVCVQDLHKRCPGKISVQDLYQRSLGKIFVRDLSLRSLYKIAIRALCKRSLGKLCIRDLLVKISALDLLDHPMSTRRNESDATGPK